jgi:hypothetical protein
VNTTDEVQLRVGVLSSFPLVNGVMKGEGLAKSKQKAKEEAAVHAFQAMGWAAAASGPYYQCA